jgi:hypothetical protein
LIHDFFKSNGIDVAEEYCKDNLKFSLIIKPSDENAVFFFKSGFSDYRCQYRIWQMIVDPEKSNKLIAAVVVDKNNSSRQVI